MAHTATRIRTGHYMYRGYEIENMAQWDSECKFWNITAPGQDEAHDAANTLADAKGWIDFWIDGSK